MEQMSLLVDWKFTTMDNGGQCVMTALVQMMQEWLVVSWGTQTALGIDE